MVQPSGGRDGRIPCRPGCGACCIVPSMSSAIPGMPEGKPAGVPCAQLTADLRCALYGLPGRPEVCIRLEPSIEMCGENAEQAMAYLAALEAATDPGGDAARLDSDGRARAER